MDLEKKQDKILFFVMREIWFWPKPKLNQTETEMKRKGIILVDSKCPGRGGGRMGTEILHEAADGHMQFHIMEVF